MRKTGLVVVALILALAFPTGANAWSNGPEYGAGFGTHDWVMYKAAQIASTRGVTWLDVNAAMAATDDPDMVIRDSYYHVYDIWGSPYGNSPARCQECFVNAVNSLRAGDTATASYWVGLLSHYYSDTCNPLHTDQTDAEESVHSNYENAVDDRTTTTNSLPGWVADDGYTFCAEAAAPARNAAAIAHTNYDSLVSGYLSGGYSAVQGITQAHLNQSANDIADLIRSIQDVAYPFVVVPNAVYRFYNNGNGTHFYTPSADEAMAVRTKWPDIYTYEGIAYFADPAKNGQPLYRFYNQRIGSHFYTASWDEAVTVMQRWPNIYTFEGPTYAVSPSPATGAASVYRFYNRRNGAHFYTISAEERDTVMQRWSNVYAYEGEAFWVLP